MPLTINVGLSRKASHNYQSEGVSINVTAELDQALLSRPEHLQREISGLYHQAQQALEHQISPHSRRPSTPSTNPQNGTLNTPSNGQRMATASQLRALQGISKRLEVDLEDQSQAEFGCNTTQLDIRQASALIDMLKERMPAKGGGR